MVPAFGGVLPNTVLPSSKNKKATRNAKAICSANAFGPHTQRVRVLTDPHTVPTVVPLRGNNSVIRKKRKRRPMPPPMPRLLQTRFTGCRACTTPAALDGGSEFRLLAAVGRDPDVARAPER